MRRKASPKTRASGILTDYSLKGTSSLDFDALATGNSIALVVVDHSVDIGAFPARIVKLKTQMLWAREMSDERFLVMSVYRQTEGSSALDLLSETVVRNATQAGQFYRRPWLTHTNSRAFGEAGIMDHFLKSLVLKNVLLDEDDDLVVGFTNPDTTFSAGAKSLHTRTEFWWKRV